MIDDDEEQRNEESCCHESIQIFPDDPLQDWELMYENLDENSDDDIDHNQEFLTDDLIFRFDHTNAHEMDKISIDTESTVSLANYGVVMFHVRGVPKSAC